MMNLLEINQRIKQRPPFQMIERVTELEPNVSATGIKNVSRYFFCNSSGIAVFCRSFSRHTDYAGSIAH